MEGGKKKNDRTNCCVPQCNSRGNGKDAVSFHKFPENERKRKQWILALRIGKPVTKRMSVCSKHFKDFDYFGNSRYTGIETKRRCRLKQTAVPSQCLPGRSSDNDRAEMVQSCCAYGCKNSFKSGKVNKGFYRFPKDEARKRKWVQAVRRKDWKPSDASRICSDHFATGKPNSNSKHPDYVPSIFSYSQKEIDSKIEYLKELLLNEDIGITVEGNDSDSYTVCGKTSALDQFLSNCLKNPADELGPQLSITVTFIETVGDLKFVTLKIKLLSSTTKLVGQPHLHCCVPSCYSFREFFFEFPETSPLREQWNKAIFGSLPHTDTRKFVCSKHFEEKDILRIRKQLDFLVPEGTVALRPSTVPTLNLGRKEAKGGLPLSADCAGVYEVINSVVALEPSAVQVMNLDRIEDKSGLSLSSDSQGDHEGQNKVVVLKPSAVQTLNLERPEDKRGLSLSSDCAGVDKVQNRVVFLKPSAVQTLNLRRTGDKRGLSLGFDCAGVDKVQNSVVLDQSAVKTLNLGRIGDIRKLSLTSNCAGVDKVQNSVVLDPSAAKTLNLDRIGDEIRLSLSSDGAGVHEVQNSVVVQEPSPAVQTLNMLNLDTGQTDVNRHVPKTAPQEIYLLEFTENLQREETNVTSSELFEVPKENVTVDFKVPKITHVQTLAPGPKIKLENFRTGRPNLKCCVPSCNSQGEYLFEFPENPRIREKWTAAIFGSSQQISQNNNKFVCSEHFEDKQIVRGNKLLPKGMVVLKPSAVPTRTLQRRELPQEIRSRFLSGGTFTESVKLHVSPVVERIE